MSNISNNKRLPPIPVPLTYWNYSEDSWSWVTKHQNPPVYDTEAFWKDYYQYLDESKKMNNPLIIRKGGMSSQTMVDLIEANYKLPLM